MRAALLFLCLASAQAQTTIPGHPRELKFAPLPYTPPRAAEFRHQLSGGATVFLVEDHELPLVNIMLMVRTGEYLDPQGKTGLAQIAGSQIRAGGTQTRPPAEFDEQAAFLAANLSSGIGDDQGSASLNCLSKDLDAGLELFIDMLRHPGFAEDRLKLAKAQMLQGLERRNDSTPSIEAREWTRLLRGDAHYSARPVTKATLEAITRQDLVEFHTRYFRPSNFILAVSGDVQTADVLARLEKALSGWPDTRAAVPPPPKPDYTPRAGIYVVHKDVNQGRVRMGHLGDLFFNPDQLAIDMMNRILGGGGFTSRITARVRSDEGLAYQAGSMFSHGFFYPGTFAAMFQSKSESVAQAAAIVKEEIQRVRDVKVTKEELDAQVQFAIESFPSNFSTPGLRAQRFAADLYFGVPEDYWRTYRDRLRALTPEDIQRVARQYLQPDKLIILVVGNAEAMLKGNPDKPQYSLPAMGAITRIPLPDPLTMVYPK